MNKDILNAHMYFRRNRIDLAENHCIKRLNEDFDDVDALYLLGTIFLKRQMNGIAAQFFSRGLILDKTRFDLWNNLGNCYKAINNDADSNKCWETALNIPGRPPIDYADLWNNFGTPFVNAGNPQGGIGFIKKALELIPDHPQAQWNLALLELEQGHYKEGFPLYEAGFKTKNRVFKDYGDNVKYWDGTPGKNVIVWGEQGIGDEILFASMLPSLMKISNKVIFDCHPNLMSLFKQSFPGLILYPTRKDDLISWPTEHKDMNAKICIGDLGKYFRTSLGDFPKHSGYLKANEARVYHYKTKLSKLGTRPKIGISWYGGKMKTRNDYRSIPLMEWKSILTKDADFISLQYTPDAYNTVSEVEDKLDVKIHHWPHSVTEGIRGEYIETASLVSALDLVITVNTSLHHLAGALGKKCWTMTPVAKAWRYFSPDEDGHSIPWYPSVYQYQQKKQGDWKHVIDRVTHDLKEFIK